MAHLMNPGFEPWLLMFRLLRSDVLSKNGLNAKTLEENDWTDLASQLIFAQMDVVYQNAVNAQREEEMAKARQKGGGGTITSGGRRR